MNLFLRESNHTLSAATSQSGQQGRADEQNEPRHVDATQVSPEGDDTTGLQAVDLPPTSHVPSACVEDHLTPVVRQPRNVNQHREGTQTAVPVLRPHKMRRLRKWFSSSSRDIGFLVLALPTKELVRII
jgi:hypothetical protein